MIRTIIISCLLAYVTRGRRPRGARSPFRDSLWSCVRVDLYSFPFRSLYVLAIFATTLLLEAHNKLTNFSINAIRRADSALTLANYMSVYVYVNMYMHVYLYVGCMGISEKNVQVQLCVEKR